MCLTDTSTMTAMDVDEDDKFEAQVAKYNIHFKALMALIPISQHEEEFDSDDDGPADEPNTKQKKGKRNPPGGKYGSKASKNLKNQYKPGMSRAEAINTKRLARKQSKAKGRNSQPKNGQEKPKGKHDKFKGKLNRFKGKK